MIRVLHVLGALNRGGAETMIMNLYRNIDRNLIQFDFIVHSLEEGDYEDEINSLGGVVYRLPQYKGKNHLLYRKSWKFFLAQHPEYKIIHGHMRSTASIYLRIAKKLGIITISHSHSTSSGSGISSVVKNIYQFYIRFTADYFLACSLNAGKWLFGKKISEKNNFFVINNGIDTSKFIFNNDKRMKKRSDLKINDELVIGHIGRFVYAKNHEFLIDIFKEIKQLKEDVVLLLIGDGEYKKKIKEKIEIMNLSKSVIMLDSQDEITEYLFVMDIFVFPSFYEGLGIAAIEAQATELPCVMSTNIPVEARLADNVSVLTLELSPKEWAHRILNVNKRNPNEIKSNLLIKERYDVKESVDFLSGFYFDILKKSKHSKFKNTKSNLN